MAPPLIAIVGAPNVGKSTLFNRLVGRRHAIVTDEPGVTRDRLYGTVVDAPRTFRIVDTGGLTPNTTAPFTSEIAQQADAAMREAVGLLFVVDARAGISAVDIEVAALLRRSGLPIVLVANKVDGPRAETTLPALFELGLQEPVPVSAEHGAGIDLLLDRIVALLDSAGAEETRADEDPPRPLEVAIVGRPNVGKSSLLNRLVGTERALVSEIPGTTRDAIDTLLRIEERAYRLIDTAGMRRPGRLVRRAERFSVDRARKNIARCDVAVLVLDATRPFAAQDAHIAGSVREAWKPLVIAVNKWDLVESREEHAKRWIAEVADRLRFVKDPPMVLVSAKSGQRVPQLLERADALYAAAGIRVPTGELNRWLQDAAAPQIGALRGASALRLFYATQTGVHPPTFLLFCNDPRRAHFSFRRYLENSLRERFGFAGAPIRLRFRGRRPAT